MRIELHKLKTIKVRPETPGEVAGTAVVATVVVINGGSETLNVDSAVVSLEAGDGELGIPTTAGKPKPLHGDVTPGHRASGRYVFMLDPVHDRAVTVSVNYAAHRPVAVFIDETP